MLLKCSYIKHKTPFHQMAPLKSKQENNLFKKDIQQFFLNNSAMVTRICKENLCILTNRDNQIEK